MNRVEFGTILEGLRNFGGVGRSNTPTAPLGTPLINGTAKTIDDFVLNET